MCNEFVDHNTTVRGGKRGMEWREGRGQEWREGRGLKKAHHTHTHTHTHFDYVPRCCVSVAISRCDHGINVNPISSNCTLSRYLARRAKRFLASRYEPRDGK